MSSTLAHAHKTNSQMTDSGKNPPINNRLTLVYIIDIMDTNLAGTENQLLKMINGLDRERFNIQLISLCNHPWLEQNAATLECPSAVFQIREFRKPRTYINIVRLIIHLRAIRPDVVHTFFPISNIVGVLAAKLAGARAIVSSRRDYGEWMSGRYLWATKLANGFVDKIIANSNAVRQLTERAEHIDNGKLGVIYNGIDIAKFLSLRRDLELRVRLAIPDQDRIVGIIANFRPMKHHHTFIQAAAIVAKTRPDVSFMLIGSGPTMTDNQTLGRELHLDHKLHFVGSQENILPFLSLMDIGVNSSEMEGLSNAVMEYMASGTPCIVSNSGGNRDLIEHNVSGYTFELGDHHRLAQLILDLLANDAERARLTAAAREKIRSEMSLQTMLASYKTLYSELVSHPKP